MCNHVIVFSGMQRCATSKHPCPQIDIEIFWLIYHPFNYWPVQTFSHPSSSTEAVQAFVFTADLQAWHNLLCRCFSKRPLGRNYHSSFVFICILSSAQRKHSELYLPACCSLSASGSFAALLREDDTCSHQRAVEKIVPQGLLVVFMNSSATHNPF